MVTYSTGTMAQSTVRSAPPSRAQRLSIRGSALALALSTLFVVADAAAAGVPIEQATAEQKQSAQTAFQAGIKLFDAKQFGPAFKEFSGSYDIVKSPNAHFMMARCLTEMGELARAFNELLVAEDEARSSPKYKTTLAESSQLRQELARKVSVIVITLKGSEQATITVEGVQIPLRKQHAVSPGEVEIVATVHGEARKRERVNLLPGDVRPITIDVGGSSDGSSEVTPPPGDGGGTQPDPEKPPKDSGGSSGTPYYVVGGISAAAAVGAGILWGITGTDYLARRAHRKECGVDKEKDNAVSDVAPGAVCDDLRSTARLSQDEEDGASQALISNIGGGLTLGFAVLSAGMFIGGAIASGGDSDDEESAVNVQVIPGPTGVTVLGTF